MGGLLIKSWQHLYVGDIGNSVPCNKISVKIIIWLDMGSLLLGLGVWLLEPTLLGDSRGPSIYLVHTLVRNASRIDALRLTHPGPLKVVNKNMRGTLINIITIIPCCHYC